MSLHDVILLLVGVGLGLAAAVFLLGGLAMMDRLRVARPDLPLPAHDEPLPADVPDVLPEPEFDRMTSAPGDEPVIASRDRSDSGLAREPASEVPRAARQETPQLVPEETRKETPEEAPVPDLDEPLPPVEPVLRERGEPLQRMSVEDLFARAFITDRPAKQKPDPDKAD